MEMAASMTVVAFAESSHYPVTIENVNYALEKTEYTYEKAPERVITFWNNSLETMLALGLGDRIILSVGMNEENLLPELKEEYEPSGHQVPVAADGHCKGDQLHGDFRHP